MRKILFLLVTTAALLSSSCGGEDSEIGSYLVEGHSRSIITDTLTALITQVKMDSIPTSDIGVGLVGFYDDPLVGKVNCAVAFEVYQPSASISEEAVFDSIVVNLMHNKTYYGDTLKNMNLLVYRLEKQLETDESDYLYNTSLYKREAASLARYSYRPHPGDTVAFTIRLPDKIGTDLMQKIIDDDYSITNEDVFKEYFKGFVLECTDEAAVVGYAADSYSMSVTLHYHLEGAINTELSTTMTARKYFTQMKSDYAGTFFEALNDGNEISSSAFQNTFFVKSGSGVYSRVEFPYLNNLLEQGSHMTITSAYLYLYPLKGSYEYDVPLPRTLYAYITNELDLQEYTSDGYASAVTGTLYEDMAYHRDTYYVFDISSFLAQELGAVGVNKRKLLITFGDSEFSTTIQRAVFGDSRHEEFPMKISVGYSFYNE